jgi:uncharacterized membrane protein YkvA (DUF1232 family)
VPAGGLIPMQLLLRAKAWLVLLRQIPLAYRLLIDARTPLRAKFLLFAVLALIVSPINWIPNTIPVLGQLDDLALLVIGLQVFFHNVPTWLRDERQHG